MEYVRVIVSRMYPVNITEASCMFQVNLGETLLEAEASENVETPVNCFRKLFGKERIFNKAHDLWRKTITFFM